jgi:hypothetical protein
MPDSVVAGWMDSLKGKSDLFRNSFILLRKMEKRVFYTGPEK